MSFVIAPSVEHKAAIPVIIAKNVDLQERLKQKTVSLCQNAVEPPSRSCRCNTNAGIRGSELQSKFGHGDIGGMGQPAAKRDYLGSMRNT